jgi:hypothetical protein
VVSRASTGDQAGQLLAFSNSAHTGVPESRCTVRKAAAGSAYKSSSSLAFPRARTSSSSSGSPPAKEAAIASWSTAR